MKCLVLMSFKGMEGWLRLSGEAQYYKGDWCGMLYKVFMGSKFIAKPLQDEFKSTKLVTVSVKRRGMFCEGHWDIFALLNKWRSNQLQIKTLIASIVKKKKKLIFTSWGSFILQPQAWQCYDRSAFHSSSVFISPLYFQFAILSSTLVVFTWLDFLLPTLIVLCARIPVIHVLSHWIKSISLCTSPCMPLPPRVVYGWADDKYMVLGLVTVWIILEVFWVLWISLLILIVRCDQSSRIVRWTQQSSKAITGIFLHTLSDQYYEGEDSPLGGIRTSRRFS